MFEPIDLTGTYTFISGVPIVARGHDTVQIGSEPGQSMLLRHAPADSLGILRGLNGTTRIADILDGHNADPMVWIEVLTRLLEAQLLVPAGDWSFPGIMAGPLVEPERDSLVHRHGIGAARRILQARQDAVVVIRGSGRVATAIATSLAIAGLGHIHQQPDRALRLGDLPDLPSTGLPAAYPAASAERDRPDESAQSRPAIIGSPTRADAALLAANLRRSAPRIRVHPPAAHHRVALVVLAGDGPPAPSLAAELTAGRIPHLAIRAGLTSAVVGPFVLPGRSSCLICALRQRSEHDSGRAEFEEALRHELVVPPAQLVCAAAAIAVADTLDHLDGLRVPSTVDGTVEWFLGEPAPRRRSWTVHPECGCTQRPTAFPAIDPDVDGSPVE